MALVVRSAVHDNHAERDTQCKESRGKGWRDAFNLEANPSWSNWFLWCYLQNKPGKNHDAAVQMQSELGENMLKNKDSLGKIGN